MISVPKRLILAESGALIRRRRMRAVETLNLRVIEMPPPQLLHRKRENRVARPR